MTTNFACEPFWPGSDSSESGVTSTDSRADYSTEALRALTAIYRLAVQRALEARREPGNSSADIVQSYLVEGLAFDSDGE
jgi:hypothetical protein